MTSRLPNYIRTHRRRAGLSQRELALLLGAASGTKVSRYENFSRIPAITTVWACEAIFNIPARELFAGQYENVAAGVRDRAQQMLEYLKVQPADRLSPVETAKVQFLRSIVELHANPESGHHEA